MGGIIIILAIFQGYRRGLIVGLFSFVAVIIGIAAAMKFSIVAGEYISKVIKISDRPTSGRNSTIIPLKFTIRSPNDAESHKASWTLPRGRREHSEKKYRPRFDAFRRDPCV